MSRVDICLKEGHSQGCLLPVKYQFICIYSPWRQHFKGLAYRLEESHRHPNRTGMGSFITFDGPKIKVQILRR